MNIKENNGNIISSKNHMAKASKKQPGNDLDLPTDDSHNYQLTTMEGRGRQNGKNPEVRTMEYYPDKDSTIMEKIGPGKPDVINIDSLDFSKIDASKLPDGLIEEEECPYGNKTPASALSGGGKSGRSKSSTSDDDPESSKGSGEAMQNTMQASSSGSETPESKPGSPNERNIIEPANVSRSAQRDMVERQKRIAVTDQKAKEKRAVEQLTVMKDQVLERAQKEGKITGNIINSVNKGLSKAATEGWIDNETVKNFQTDLKAGGVYYEVKKATENVPFEGRSELVAKVTESTVSKIAATKEEKEKIKSKVLIKEYKDSWQDKAKFENDPKEWCWNEINRNEKDLINEGVLNLTDKAQRAQHAIKVGLRLQREMMPGKKPRYLSNEEREKMNIEYAKLEKNGKPDWNARLELVKIWKELYGEYYENVLSEIELEPKQELLLRVGTNAEKSYLNAIIRFVDNEGKRRDTDPGDYSDRTNKDSLWNKQGIGLALKTEFENKDIGNKIGEMVVINGRNALPPWLREGLKMMYQEAERYKKSGMTTESAARAAAGIFTRTLDKGIQVVTDPKAGSVIVPKHYDEFFVNTGLAWIRNNVISSTKNLDPNDRIIWKNDGDRLSLVKIDGQGNEELLKDEVGELYDFSPMEVHRIVENSVFGYRVDPDLIDLNQSMKPLIDTEKIGKTMDYLRGIDTKHTGRNKLWDQKQWNWEDVVQAVMNDNIGSRLMWVLMENNIKIDADKPYSGKKGDRVGVYYPFRNKIQIACNLDTDDAVMTLIHEAKHALDDLIEEGWKGIREKYNTSNTDQNRLDMETSANLSQILTLEALRVRGILVKGKKAEPYQPGDFQNISVRIDQLKKGIMVDKIYDLYKNKPRYKLNRNKVSFDEPLDLQKIPVK